MTVSVSTETAVYQQLEQPATTADLIDYLLARRSMVIMELRDIDRRLVQYGRLRQETLPRRER